MVCSSQSNKYWGSHRVQCTTNMSILQHTRQYSSDKNSLFGWKTRIHRQPMYLQRNSASTLLSRILSHNFWQRLFLSSRRSSFLHTILCTVHTAYAVPMLKLASVIKITSATIGFKKNIFNRKNLSNIVPFEIQCFNNPLQQSRNQEWLKKAKSFNLFFYFFIGKYIFYGNLSNIKKNQNGPLVTQMCWCFQQHYFTQIEIQIQLIFNFMTSKLLAVVTHCWCSCRHQPEKLCLL